MPGKLKNMYPIYRRWVFGSNQFCHAGTALSLNTYYVSKTILDSTDTAVNKTNRNLHGINILVHETDHKKLNK